MTSTTLMDMLKTSVTETYPEIDVTGSGKVEILNAVMNARGWHAILELGSRIQDYVWHPVLSAIVAPSEPARVLDRWRRLERFGHTRNREVGLPPRKSVRRWPLPSEHRARAVLRREDARADALCRGARASRITPAA